MTTDPLAAASCNCDHWFQIFDGSGSLAFTIRVPWCECWAAPRPQICCPLWQAEVLAE